MNEEEYCNICNDWFPVNEESDVLCDCGEDPYLADSTKELNFED